MIDLTGSWQGHYEQNGGRHGISMVVAQRGSSFVGRMRDAHTLIAGTEKLDASVPGFFGKATTVEVVHSLPEESDIEGSVEGSAVEVVKRYRGKATSMWVAGGSSLHNESADHRVIYRGLLDESGSLLRGEWRIVSNDSGHPDLVDSFELRRAP